MTTPNREQRRAKVSRLPLNGRPPVNALRQLDQPVLVGTISVAQANEIKSLNKLQKRLEEDAEHARLVAQVASMHRNEYLMGLLGPAGLDPRNAYQIDDESGEIMMLAEHSSDELTVVATPDEET